jgi:hypothetical protein
MCGFVWQVDQAPKKLSKGEWYIRRHTEYGLGIYNLGKKVYYFYGTSDGMRIGWKIQPKNTSMPNEPAVQKLLCFLALNGYQNHKRIDPTEGFADRKYKDYKRCRAYILFNNITPSKDEQAVYNQIYNCFYSTTDSNIITTVAQYAYIYIYIEDQSIMNILKDYTKNTTIEFVLQTHEKTCIYPDYTTCYMDIDTRCKGHEHPEACRTVAYKQCYHCQPDRHPYDKMLEYLGNEMGIDSTNP